jgi:colanic acid/amylovoran biosynthesis glycosyltransferase
MKIGIVQGSCPTQSEIFVYNQAMELRSMGHEIRLFALRSKTATSQLRKWFKTSVGIPVFHPFFTPNIPFLKRIFVKIHFLFLRKNERAAFKSLMETGGPAPWMDPAQLFFWAFMLRKHSDLDVILAHFAPLGGVIAMLKAKGFVRAPLVTVLHGADVTADSSKVHLQSGLYNALWSECSAYTYVSDKIRNSAIQMGFPSAPMYWIPMGVNVKEFTKPIQVAKNNTIVILTVARLVEKKGISDCIKALKRLHSDGYSFNYNIIGEGSLRCSLEKLIQTSGLTKQVKLLGARDPSYVRKALFNSDIFLLASKTAPNGDTEGLPVVLLEAQASQLPVISTRHSGIPQAVVEGETALLVDEGDVEGLTKAMKTLFNNECLRKSMGAAGLKHVKLNFSADLLARRLIHILETHLKNDS